MNRTIIIVLDSVGVGALPDAREYGDEGSDTLGNTAAAVGGLELPNLGALGLGNIIEVAGVPRAGEPQGCYGKMGELSPGKDTTTGHWEMMGIKLSTAFPTYPSGFPREIIERFERLIGSEILGNKAASGTEIIEELGEEHMRTGRPIVYTSADSVFQIAAHEDVIRIGRLYEICRIAREILVGEHAVGRVIARPFAGSPGSFVRTPRRKDFSLTPPGKTVLDYAREAGHKVYGVGKIGEIFTMRGIDESIKTGNNMEGLDRIAELMSSVTDGIIFANLVDFDSVWGHRNNVGGYAEGLEAVDRRLPEVLRDLRSGDALFITADHGCDPTTPSTDHSREYVPLLVTGPRLTAAVDLGIRESHADLGKTIAGLMGFDAPVEGESFASRLVD
ncbi:MAG: phosphopentomutase [Chloroflexi bacterium]|nr:phosphopentomutase [Chloroflexota bacterium]